MPNNNPLPQPPLSPRPPSYRPLPPPRDNQNIDSPRPPPYVSRLSMPPPYVRGEQPPLPPTPTAPPLPPRPHLAAESPRSEDKELPSLPVVGCVEWETSETLATTLLPVDEQMALVVGGQRETPERPLPLTPEDVRTLYEDIAHLSASELAVAVYERPLPALPGGGLLSRAAYVSIWESTQSLVHESLEPPLPTLPNILGSDDDMRPLPPLPDEDPGCAHIYERPLPSTPGEDPRARPLPAPPDSVPDGTTPFLLARPTRSRIIHSNSDGDGRIRAQIGIDTTPLLPPLPGAREKIPPLVTTFGEKRGVKGARRHSCGSESGQSLREEVIRGRRRDKVKGLVGGLKRRGASGESVGGGAKDLVRGRESTRVPIRKKEEGTVQVVVPRRHSTGRRGRTPDQEATQSVADIQEFFGGGN